MKKICPNCYGAGSFDDISECVGTCRICRGSGEIINHEELKKELYRLMAEQVIMLSALTRIATQKAGDGIVDPIKIAKEIIDFFQKDNNEK